MLELCPRCQCCSYGWVRCDACGGEGVSGHDCGEDTCCCLYPEDNVTCDICDGQGGLNECLGRCDENGKHDRSSKTFKSMSPIETVEGHENPPPELSADGKWVHVGLPQGIKVTHKELAEFPTRPMLRRKESAEEC